MRRRTNSWCFLVCLAAACTTARAPRPTPLPSLPSPVPLPPGSGPWTFNYAPGAISYQVSRSAVIESLSDSGNHQETSTNLTHELLTLQQVADTIHFTAVVDTFWTTTQGTIGPVQPVQLPVQLLGAHVGDSLIVLADSAADKCSPVSSALSADLNNLLVRFPVQLSQGTRWRDSVDLQTCHGMIPTAVHIIRSYIVSGETEYQGNPVLVVQRADTIRAHGEGAQQQHRVTLEATGTGNASYYLSTRDGRIVRLNAGQDLALAITASGRIHRFKETSKQDFGYSR